MHTYSDFIGTGSPWSASWEVFRRGLQQLDETPFYSKYEERQTCLYCFLLFSVLQISLCVQVLSVFLFFFILLSDQADSIGYFLLVQGGRASYECVSLSWWALMCSGVKLTSRQSQLGKRWRESAVLTPPVSFTLVALAAGVILSFASLRSSPVAPFTTKWSSNSSPFSRKKMLLGWARSFFFFFYTWQDF